MLKKIIRLAVLLFFVACMVILFPIFELLLDLYFDVKIDWGWREEAWEETELVRYEDRIFGAMPFLKGKTDGLVVYSRRGGLNNWRGTTYYGKIKLDDGAFYYFGKRGDCDFLFSSYRTFFSLHEDEKEGLVRMGCSENPMLCVEISDFAFYTDALERFVKTGFDTGASGDAYVYFRIYPLLLLR